MCWEGGQHWKVAMLSHASGRFNGDSPGGGTEPWHLKAEMGGTGLSSPPLDSVQGSIWGATQEKRGWWVGWAVREPETP